MRVFRCNGADAASAYAGAGAAIEHARRTGRPALVAMEGKLFVCLFVCSFLSYLILSYLSYLILSYLILSYLILSHRVSSHLVLPYPLSSLFFFFFFSFFFFFPPPLSPHLTSPQA